MKLETDFCHFGYMNDRNGERVMDKKFSRVCASLAVPVMLVFPAQAEIRGTIDATIALEAGCMINGQNHDDGDTAANFGSINFGVHNTLFTQADAQVVNGASAFEVQCSPGITPVISFGAGQNDSKGTGVGVHAMAHITEANKYVTYNLYSDPGRGVLIPIGGEITLESTGASQTVDVYGRAFGESGLVMGAYGDVITVVLEL